MKPFEAVSRVESLVYVVPALLGALMIGSAWMMLSTAPAAAARIATVDIPNTYLREGPGAEFAILTKLPKGARIAASNFPTDGYYKVRTDNGEVGFIPANALFLPDSRATGRDPASAALASEAGPETNEYGETLDPQTGEVVTTGDSSTTRGGGKRLMAPVLRRAGR